jgi:ArsR family transcriptional regulator
MNMPTRDTLTPEKKPAAACCTPISFEQPGTKYVERTADVFKAIGHPVRLQILMMLGLAEEPVCVCDIERPFSIKQPTISHHLRILREEGLVEAEQRGTWVYYNLRPGALRPLRDLLNRLTD